MTKKASLLIILMLFLTPCLISGEALAQRKSNEPYSTKRRNYIAPSRNARPRSTRVEFKSFGYRNKSNKRKTSVWMVKFLALFGLALFIVGGFLPGKHRQEIQFLRNHLVRLLLLASFGLLAFFF